MDLLGVKQGWQGGCGGGTMDGGIVVRKEVRVVGLAVDAIGGIVVARGVSGG